MNQLNFKVKDMTCGGCAGKIKDALNSSAPDVQVEIDLATKKVSIRGELDEDTAMEIIRSAGYTPGKFKKGWFAKS